MRAQFLQGFGFRLSSCEGSVLGCTGKRSVLGVLLRVVLNNFENDNHSQKR